jgi:hypothetical protein
MQRTDTLTNGTILQFTSRKTLQHVADAATLSLPLNVNTVNPTLVSKCFNRRPIPPKINPVNNNQLICGVYVFLLYSKLCSSCSCIYPSPSACVIVIIQAVLCLFLKYSTRYPSSKLPLQCSTLKIPLQIFQTGILFVCCF